MDGLVAVVSTLSLNAGTLEIACIVGLNGDDAC